MSDKTSIAIVQVKFKKRERPKSLGGGLYKKRDGTFWERPKINGRRSERKIPALNERRARDILMHRRAQQNLAREGIIKNDPYKRIRTETIKDLAEFYLANKCPKRDLSARAGRQLEEEQKRITSLVAYFGNEHWTTLSLEDCRAYHHHRVKQIARGTGDRTVDMELQCLSSIFRWAQRNSKRTGVNTNPFLYERPRFQSSSKVRHCRECMPASGDELHLIAATFFKSGRSHVLGWQTLFEAFIGQRTHEILKLRWDAKNENEPGFIRDNHLFLFRSSTSKGTFPYIEIHPALSQALTSLEWWHQMFFPESPWFFPGWPDGKQHVDTKSLTHALRRIGPRLKIPHRTSHGLRSFYVNVLRSDRDEKNRPRLSDAEIALRIGQKTGGKLIIDTYGEILPYKLDWMPAKRPVAWTCFLEQPLQLQLSLNL